MTRIETPHGTLVGVARDDGGVEYRGIRFATAARFSDPVDHPGTDGLVDCTSWGPLCPQNPGMLETMAGYDASSTSEDCLVLNVFVPPGTTADSRLPVMVWIHGGAYLNGAGSLAWYHGGRLAEGGAVVVTINYRLGVLGYLGTGNHGTLDQISALRWVARNISALGGDPGKVTIFGESAGGSAVISLMASPEARGLFHRVWAMSPSIGQLRSVRRAEESCRDYLDRLGASSVDDLRDVPIERLLAAQAEHVLTPSQGYDHFSPTAGGPGLDADILGTAATNPVPLVVGTTRDENKLFSAFDPQSNTKTEDDWRTFSGSVFGERAEAARAVYERLRGGAPWELISAVNTDVGFRQHVRRLAEARHAASTPTWVYWFTWASTAFGGRFGSCHALDIPFAFDNLEAHGVEALTGDSPGRAELAARFGEELHGLAMHGHPSWAQWDDERRPVLRLDTTVELLHDPEPEITALFA